MSRQSDHRQPPDRPPREFRNPTATWVAGVGACLVLLAALVLVVDAWSEIRPEVKLLGLVALNVAVAVAASAACRGYPAVARVLAHLAATLTVPSGIAAAATGHARWPVAICLGGVAGVVGCVATHHRWRAPWLVPAAEASAVLALAGVAALTDIPLGVLVAALALTRLVAAWVAEGGRLPAFAAGRTVSDGLSDGSSDGSSDGLSDGLSVGSGWSGTARLALVAAAMPSMALLGRVGIGPGTMVRLGARGDALEWAGPLAGTTAAVVLAMVAWRHRSTILLPASLASLLVGWAMAIPEGVDAGWWWSALPALIVLFAVATAEALGSDLRPAGTLEASGREVNAVESTHAVQVTGAAGATVVGPLLLWHRLPVGLRSAVTHGLLMASVAFPLVMASVLWQRPHSSGAALSLGLWAAALLAAGLPGALRGWWIPIGLVFRAQALVVLAAFAGAVLGSDRAQVLAVAGITVGLAVLHLWTKTHLSRAPWFALLPEQVVAAGLSLLLLIRLRVRLEFDPAPWVSLVVLAAVATMVGAGRAVAQRRPEAHRSTDASSIVGAMLGVPRPETLIDHVMALGAGLALALVWPAGSELVTAIAGLGAGMVVLACGWHRHSVAAAVPMLALLLAQHGGLSLEQSLQLCLVGGVALAGAAAVFTRWTPLSSGAVAASVTVFGGAVDHHHVLASLAGALLGAQLFWCGRCREWAPLRWIGAAVFGLCAASLPVTSGLLPWLLEELEARGITGTDVSAAALTLGMLAVGAVMAHRSLKASGTDGGRPWTSWATLAPGLVLGGLYLLSTYAARPQEGRLAAALAFGVLAVGAGGRWRLAAPLLLGSGLLVAVVVQAAGERLAALPAWSWLAIGGTFLLLVGLSIERRSLPRRPHVGGEDLTDPGRDGLLADTSGPARDRRLLVALWNDLR